jgi:hypothetical protein
MLESDARKDKIIDNVAQRFPSNDLFWNDYAYKLDESCKSMHVKHLFIFLNRDLKICIQSVCHYL